VQKMKILLNLYIQSTSVSHILIVLSFDLRRQKRGKGPQNIAWGLGVHADAS